VKQLVAEQQVIVRSRRGFAARTEWRQLRPRNEALDARVYARAAVWLAGVDRWSDNRWRALEEQLGLEAPPERKLVPVASQPVAAAPAPPLPAPSAAAMAGNLRAPRSSSTGARRRRVSYWPG
jgi:phage terminase large subunit GpA-like protein